MELILKRQTRTDTTTIGQLFDGDKALCYVLEDTDRGLKQTDTLAQIIEKKIYGQTAIPAGRYEVVITYSNRFKQYMPLLLNVPGYEGIRIHPGNAPADTLGCLLPGRIKISPKRVGESKLAYGDLLKKLKSVEKKEKIWLTVM